MSWLIKFLVLLYIRYYMFVYTIQYRAFNRLSPLSLLQRSIAYCTIQVSSGWMYWLYFTLFSFVVCTLQCTVQYRRSKNLQIFISSSLCDCLDRPAVHAHSQRYPARYDKVSTLGLSGPFLHHHGTRWRRLSRSHRDFLKTRCGTSWTVSRISY